MKKPARKASDVPPMVRVAVYCRKSTTHGLEQEFNSIDAQQEAVEAYVKSQRAQGWVVLPRTYHDGGFSGGNTDRPAFQALMRDVEAGEIDVVAVYRLDRLSRSQRDFLNTLDEFNKNGVQFVSVTEHFDTTTSIGRFTLSIVVAVAELERDTISQRTRDKMGASRRRGQWCGGAAVFGYLVENKKLVIEDERAEQVREMFRLYLELGSLVEVARELNRRGWTTARGREWDKAKLRALLTNVTFIGKVTYKQEVHEGQHEPLIDQATWDAVQARLRTNRATGASTQRNRWGALLKGLLRCGACGSGMTHHYTSKGEKRYRYYVCERAVKQGAKACPGSRVAAADIEPFVVERVRELLHDPAMLIATLQAAETDQEERRPGLVAEVRQLETGRRKLDDERRGILAAIPSAGDAVSALTTRLAEIDAHLQRLGTRLQEVRAQILDLSGPVIDEADLREALTAFAPLWGELVVKERVRLLNLLVEKVTYDGQAGDVAITFRPAGLRSAAQRRSA